MTQSKKIAVTGGIGSGKTTFCNILKELGYPTFSCDEISDELWENEEYLAGLSALFPQCTEHGKPQKKLVSALVFSDKDALQRLNSFAHPRIMDVLFDRMKRCRVAIAEVPLLFEGGYERFFDAVVVVTRKREQRLHAAALRDRSDEEEIAARMGAQIAPSAIEGKDAIVVENDGSAEDLKAKAKEVVRLLGL